MLREGLLEGCAVLTAGPLRAAVADRLGALGAELRPEDRAGAGADALVVDAATLFAAADAAVDELAPLRAAADGTWEAVRSVATGAWIEPQAPGGKLLVLAPRPGDGPHAGAARDALENLARTTSIEWARFGIRIVTVTPGDTTSDDEVATIAAYLVSAAGDYFSGCRLDLA